MNVGLFRLEMAISGPNYVQSTARKQKEDNDGEKKGVTFHLKWWSQSKKGEGTSPTCIPPFFSLPEWQKREREEKLNH